VGQHGISWNLAQKHAQTLVRPTRRPLNKDVMNLKRRQQYAEKLLIKRAKASGDDATLGLAVSTPTGRRMMPLLSRASGKLDVEFAQMKINTKKLMAVSGRHYRASVVHLLVDGLPPKFCRTELGITKTQMAQNLKAPVAPKEDRFGRASTAPSLEDCDYPTDVHRCKVSEAEEVVLAQFFVHSTYVCSGADRQTRILGKAEWEWGMQLHAEYPTHLRSIAKQWPAVIPDSTSSMGHLTVFQANLLSALWAADQPDFNEAAETTARAREWKKLYVRKLLVKQGMEMKQTSEEKDAAAAVVAERKNMRASPSFDPSKFDVRGVGLKGLKSFLKRASLRYTSFSMPHPCPKCDDGETWEAQLKVLAAEKTAAAIATTPWTGEKAKKLSDLMRKVKEYRLHLDQLATGRKETKILEEKLLPGEVIIIRDFVNHHDHSGKHVKCLHWVVMWRDVIGQPLKHLKLRHYCSDGESMMTDSYFTADVMDFHLHPGDEHHPGLFDHFHRLYFVGDHGPHFASAPTVYNESAAFFKYGKEVVPMFYTSYHAFGRADGAGAEDSCSLVQDAKNGLPRYGAESFTAMTNNSNDRRSWAYMFPKINRNVDLFPAGVNAKDKRLRKWSEISYEYEGRCLNTVGICRYRLVSGTGQWIWCDLLAGSRAPDQDLCEACSTQEQKLVFHAAAECPNPYNVHALPTYRDCAPDPSRIIPNKQKRRPLNRGEKASTMLVCKVIGCVTDTGRPRRFKKAATANLHLKIYHKLTGPAYTAVSFPVADESEAMAAAPVTGQVEGKATSRIDAEEEEEDMEEDEEEAPPTQGRLGLQQRKRDARGDTDDDEDEDTTEDEDKDDEDDDEEEENRHFVVEKILADRKDQTGRVQYQVQWVGYPGATTWEPVSSFADKTLLSDYRKQKGKRGSAPAEKGRAGSKKKKT
jgi:hypothetical protein